MNIFVKKFHHHPDDIACQCCGENYTTDSDESLEKLTEFQRGKRFCGPKKLLTLDEFKKKPDIKIIYAVNSEL